MSRLHDPDAPDPPVGEFSASELGAMLRESRVSLGRELEDVAAELRIRLVYLQAIEQGRLEELPGIAYATGFLRAYADFLGLDGEDLVRRFKAVGMAMTQATDLHLPSPVEEGRLPTGSVLLVAALLAVGAYGGWYYMSSQGRDPIETVAALPDQLAELVGIESENRQAAGAADSASSAGDGAAPTTSDEIPTAVATAEETAVAAAAPVATPADDATGSTATTQQAAPALSARNDQPPPSPVATAEATGEAATDRVASTTDAAPTPAASAPVASAPVASTPAAPTPAAPTPAAPAPAAPTVARAVPPEPPAAPKRKPVTEARATAPPIATGTAPMVADSANHAPSATTIVAAATSGESSVADAVTPGPAPAVTPPRHRVVLRASIDTWVEVAAAEETPLLSRLMREGETFVVPTRPGLMMATGNAGGIEILVDGKMIPRLGPIGEIRKNVALDAESLLRAGAATP